MVYQYEKDFFFFLVHIDEIGGNDLRHHWQLVLLNSVQLQKNLNFRSAVVEKS